MLSSSTSQSTSEDDALTEAELVDQLNNLLFSLNVPLALVSPADLTPTLLMAILESLLGVKIPLLQEYDDGSPNAARILKVQQMKMFLGVLETDIVQSDVGLSAIDPRRLADGDWDEVCFVGQILCWIGRKEGLIPAEGHSMVPMTPPHQTASYHRFRAKEAEQPKPSLSPRSLLNLEARSLFQPRTPSSSCNTPHAIPRFLTDPATGVSDDDEYIDNDSILSELHLPLPPHTQDHVDHSLLFSRPINNQGSHGVHEDASFDANTSHSFCFCPPEVAALLPVEHDHPETRTRLPILHSGYIRPAEEEEELASFESTRSFLRTFVPSPDKSRTNRRAVRDQYTKTLELLNERARLLSQLAELKTNG
ncbi:hypothetical protein BJ165DRAFT_1533381 [Panaeolus papilionaceus]|nr:hypothetical protein BJ165DRAFT_1533381 [Panaeolus papilionaceus]